MRDIIGELVIYLQTETITFRVVQSKKECFRFINEVNKLVFGADAEVIKDKNSPLESLSSVFSQVKDYLGIPDKDDIIEEVAKKCDGCGYENKGKKGTVVKCPYCGKPNQM